MNWSYTALKDFEQCARRYHEVRVLKRYPREETEQTRYGEQMHAAAQVYATGEVLGEGFEFMRPLLDALLAKPGDKYPEFKMTLDTQLEPCAWKSRNAWVRGTADLLIVDGPLAWVVDYKTGKATYPDKDQLDLMSLLTFKHFPNVMQVNSALVFVLKDVFVKHKRYRTEEEKLWWQYRERLAKLEKAAAANVWNPTQSGLCKKYCPVLTCEFNGRN